MKDLAIVVALLDSSEREAVTRRLRDRLNPLGRRHVTVVMAPVGGVEFWNQLYGPLQSWGADHIVGDEAYVCVDHEPGLHEWTSSAMAQFQFMVRVANAAERAEYEGQFVNTLEAEDLTSFVNMVMAVTPALDPDDAFSGAFIGIDPMVASEPPDANPFVLEDEDGMTDLDVDGPEWAVSGSDGKDVLAAPAPPADIVSEEEDESAPPPTENAIGTGLEKTNMELSEENVSTSFDGVGTKADQAPMAGPAYAEDLAEAVPAPVARAAGPIPALTQAPDAFLLEGEPDADIDEEDEVAFDEGWYAGDDGPVDEGGGTAAAPVGVSAGPVAELEADEQEVGSDPEFFGEYEHALPSVPAPAAMPEPHSITREPPPDGKAPYGRVDEALVDGEVAAGAVADDVTPHPWIMYAQYQAAEQHHDAPAPVRLAPRPELKLPTYAGPEAFPPPIADVWEDVSRQTQVPVSAGPDPDARAEMPPVLDPVAADVSPAAVPVPGLAHPPDEGPFRLDLDVPADPWGYVGDPDVVAPARAFAAPRPAINSPALAVAPQVTPAASPSAGLRGQKHEAGSGLVGTLLSRLRPQGAVANGRGKAHSLVSTRRVALSRAPKRRYTDEELAGFLESGLGGIVAVGALKGGVGKTATSNVIADIAGKVLSTNNASAAWVDGNLNNPDAGGFFRDALSHSRVSVQTVVAALTNGDVIPEPLKATAESVALYPEAKGVEEYSKTQLDQLQQYLRRQHRLSVIDLANVLPAWGSGPAASAALFWLEFADVIVVPTDLNPTSSLPDACDYIRAIVERFGPPASVGGKPIFVPYIVPPGRKVISDGSVQEALAELEDLGATLCHVPYKAMVMLAGAHHQSLDSLDKALSQSYRALTEAVIVAFADARERAGR